MISSFSLIFSDSSSFWFYISLEEGYKDDEDEDEDTEFSILIVLIVGLEIEENEVFLHYNKDEEPSIISILKAIY